MALALRALFGLLFFVAPLTAVVLLLFGTLPAIAVGAWLLCVWLVLLTQVERLVSRRTGPTQQASQGIWRTYAYAVDGHPQGQEPKLVVVESPAPNALVACSWGGRGWICLSQGLLTVLNESELRSVIRYCATRVQAPGLPVQALCGWIADSVLRYAPRSWVRLTVSGSSGPNRGGDSFSYWTFFLFLLLFPIARVFIFLGGGRAREDRDLADLRRNDPEFDSALRKIRRAGLGVPSTVRPGLFCLYLVNPLPPSGVLSLSSPPRKEAVLVTRPREG